MSGYTPPPRYAGIIELAGNGEKDLGAQSLAGKILISQNLEAGNWPQSQNGKECEFPKACSPAIRARAINTAPAHSTSSLHPVQKQNQRGNTGAPPLPAFGGGGDFRKRRLISLLKFSDKPEASKFAEKCRKHSQNGKSMGTTI